MSLGNQYEGWNTDSHLMTFDGWNRQSDAHFEFVYGNFAEQRFLKEAAGRLENPTILDVGCATGTTYRYLRKSRPAGSFDYLGLDLSEPAVRKASSLYPEAKFVAKGREALAQYLPGRRDIVFSRDTVLHQTAPYEFLADLLSVAERVLIVRLRTRDRGDTVFDTDASCQMHYDRYWMPYIVLNTDELLGFLSKESAVRKITVNRSYEVLGGQNYRYLPKDLYMTEAGGAETALMIELDRTTRQAEPPQIVFDDLLEGHAFQRRHRFKRYLYGAASRLRRMARRT